MTSVRLLCSLLLLLLPAGCVTLPGGAGGGDFDKTCALVEKHAGAVVLSAADGGAKIAVSPRLQGTVVASVAVTERYCCGWLNAKAVAAGSVANGDYGGEDRFRLAPEGGQFSLFYRKGDVFSAANRRVPPELDDEPFDVVSEAKDRIEFNRNLSLINYAGCRFSAGVSRSVRVLDAAELSSLPGIRIGPGVTVVAFESRNTLINSGASPWRRESGLPAIKIRASFKVSPQTVIVVPFIKGDEKVLGPVINRKSPGVISDKRLKIGDGVLFFKADGLQEGGFGLARKRAGAVLGSYDEQHGVLTIIQFNKPSAARDYVNSELALQKNPYSGNVITVYDSGPRDDGAFYRIETASPAARLGVGGSITHIHRTIHFYGSPQELDPLARKLLGVSIADIRLAL